MAGKPDAPESIPKYIAEGMGKQDEATLHDIIEHAEQLLAHYDGQEPEIPDNAEVVEEADDGKGGSIVLEMVKCGKDACHCAKDGDLHGPYKYRYWSENGTTKKEYVGKAN